MECCIMILSVQEIVWEKQLKIIHGLLTDKGIKSKLHLGFCIHWSSLWQQRFYYTYVTSSGGSVETNCTLLSNEQTRVAVLDYGALAQELFLIPVLTLLGMWRGTPFLRNTSAVSGWPACEAICIRVLPSCKKWKQYFKWSFANWRREHPKIENNNFFMDISKKTQSPSPSLKGTGDRFKSSRGNITLDLNRGDPSYVSALNTARLNFEPNFSRENVCNS